MSLDVFNACVKGYSDRLFDEQVLSIQQGYWAGYFIRSKKSKPVDKIIETLRNAHDRNERTIKNTKPDVDVEAFLAMESNFQAQYNKLRG